MTNEATHDYYQTRARYEAGLRRLGDRTLLTAEERNGLVSLMRDMTRAFNACLSDERWPS